MTAVLTCHQASDRRVAGRYRLIRTLGSGSAGLVWLAYDELLEREVALKRVHRANPAGRAVDEARAAAAISHPCTVLVLDVLLDASNEVDWVVMEALSGQSLADVLCAGDFIDVAEAAYICRCVLAALDAIHAVGLLHRDVKPGNIQLCRDGRVVLLDFGLAADPSPAAPAMIVGSLPYLAPEIVGGGAYSVASDLYALGMTLYATLTGCIPPVRTCLFDPSIADDRGSLTLPSDLAPLDRLVLQLTDPDPLRRPSPLETRRVLEGI